MDRTNKPPSPRGLPTNVMPASNGAPESRAEQVAGRPRRTAQAAPPEAVLEKSLSEVAQMATASPPRHIAGAFSGSVPPELPASQAPRRHEPEFKGQRKQEAEGRGGAGDSSRSYGGGGFWNADDDEAQGRNPRLTAVSIASPEDRQPAQVEGPGAPKKRFGTLGKNFFTGKKKGDQLLDKPVEAGKAAAPSRRYLSAPLQTEVELAIAAAAASPGNPEAMAHYMAAISQASGLLNDSEDSQCSEFSPKAVVLDAIAYQLKKPIERSQVQALFLSLPGSELIAIGTNEFPVGLGGINRAAVIEIARECMEVRRNESEKSFREQLDVLRGWPHNADTRVVRDPQGLAECAIQAAEQLAMFRSYGGEHGPVQCTPLRCLVLGAYVGTLEPRQLKTLERALKTLRCDEGELIEAERIASRQRNLEARATSVIAAFNSLGDVTAPRPTTLTDVLRELRQAREEFPGHIFAQDFPDQLSNQLSKMPSQNRRKLAAAMHGKVGELCAALRELRGMRQLLEYDELCAELKALESALGAVRAAVGATPAADTATSRFILKLDGLSPEVRDALKACGIEIGTQENVILRSGIASRTVQQAIKDNLHAMQAAPDADFGALPELRGPLELVGPVPLDPTLLRALHRVASLRTMAGVNAAISSPNGPITLPDGTPVELLGERTSTFTIRSDGKGGLVVRCALGIRAVTGLRTFGPMERNTTGVLAKVNAEFAYDVAISPQGMATVAKPLEFSTTAIPERWNHAKTYAKPTSVYEIFGTTDAQKSAQEDFLAFLKSEYSEENYHFIMALDSLDGNIQSAMGIIDDFIAEGATRQLNLPSKVLQDIKAAALTNSGERLKEAFQQARLEILNLMERDSFKRFVTKTEDEARAAAVSGLQPAPTPDLGREPAAWRKAASLVGQRVERLSGLLMTTEDFKGAAGLLSSMMPDVPQNEAYWNEYSAHVKARLEKLKGPELASLQYNLNTALNASERNDPYLRTIHSAVIEALRGHPEGRMTPESAVLKASRGRIEPQLVATWLAQPRRVSAEQVSEVLASLPTTMLRPFADPTEAGDALAGIADGVLSARRKGIKTLGLQIIADTDRLNAPAWLADPTGELARSNMRRVASLALEFSDHSAKVDEARLSTTSEAERVQKHRADLVSTLEQLFTDDRFQGQNWRNDEINKLMTTLGALGSNRCEDKLKGILRLRELGREEDRRSQLEEQRRLGELRALAAETEEIPPPPPPPEEPPEEFAANGSAGPGG